jgi:hypothetical protein
MTDPRPVPGVEPRPLNAEERAVLDLLLAPEFPGAAQLRCQVAHMRVVGRCSCGCATVDLEVAPGMCEPAPDRGSPIVSEAEVIDDTGEPRGGVIVFLTAGYLSMLEVYAHSTEPIRTWPPLDRLRPILQEG